MTVSRTVSRWIGGCLTFTFLIIVLLAQPSSAWAAPKEITLMTWGGVFSETFKPVAKQFEKDTGISVKFIRQSGSSDGLSKLMAQRNNPQVDVWTSILSTVASATKAGILAELRAADIPNLKTIPSELVSKTGVAVWQSPRGIFYRNDLVPFKITKWEDLWDPRLKGKVGASFKLDRGSFLILSALLNGGSEYNIDPGFAKVKALKDNLHAVYNTDPESTKLLETGEISVAGWGILPNIYRHLGPGSKYEFVMPEPRFLAVIPVSIVKGRGVEQESGAAKFIDYILNPEIQGKLVSVVGTIPSNPNAILPKKLIEVIPPLPLKGVYNVDWDVVNKSYSEWEDRWAKEIQTR